MASRTRDRILDASTELFCRQGMAGTGLKAIVAAADAPFGSLYHHFPGGKDELVAETIRRAGAAYQDRVAAVLASAADAGPEEAVRVAFLHAADTLRAGDWADACPIETVALEVASTNERLRLATAEVFAAWLEAGTALFVAAGIEPGPARTLALMFVAALEGAFVLDRASRTTDALEAAARSFPALVRAARLGDIAAEGVPGRDG